MLFNAPVFIFVFVPTVVGLYHALLWAGSARGAMLALVTASLVFYGYWDWAYVPLVLLSIAANFVVARRLADQADGPLRMALAAIGIAVNLVVLGYYKYTNFLVDQAALVAGTDWATRIVLPIGLSFFTFQQIGYLADAYARLDRERDPLRYALFVLFFPQLIAGPIVHHGEMMPQFGQRRRALGACLAVGLTIFTIGLAKKVLIADELATIASPVFDAAALGVAPGFVAAALATLAYTFQIYFDFSGYADMAIGLGWMFGVRLPPNFASPYKATSIVDFWRRWHLTLSRFLRDYLYVPLGGNRVAPARRYLNVFVVMVLGGIWHGAGWTFLLWGVLHGGAIVVAQGWARMAGLRPASWLRAGLGWAATFVFVALAWIPFRAANLDAARLMFGGLVSLQMGEVPIELDLAGLVVLAAAAAIAFLAPNVIALMRTVDPVLPVRGYPATQPRTDGGGLVWRPGPVVALLVAGLFVVTTTRLSAPSEFIYFQF